MATATTELIAWETDIEAAQKEAQLSGKMVLVELFSPQCVSCKNMEERTFSDPKVADYIAQNFAPVHYDVLANEDAMKQNHAGWTPTVTMQCPNGDDHRRFVGFLTPHKLIGELAISRVQYHLATQDFDGAHKLAQQAVELTQGDELRHVEALYWQGVAAYKASGDQGLLIAAWKDILARFPDSEWASRVDFAREL